MACPPPPPPGAFEAFAKAQAEDNILAASSPVISFRLDVVSSGGPLIPDRSGQQLSVRVQRGRKLPWFWQHLKAHLSDMSGGAPACPALFVDPLLPSAVLDLAALSGYPGSGMAGDRHSWWTPCSFSVDGQGPLEILANKTFEAYGVQDGSTLQFMVTQHQGSLPYC